MKTSFIHKNFGDKVLITLLVNGKKEGFVYKMTKDGLFSHYESIKDAEKNLLMNYQSKTNTWEYEEGE